MIVHLTDTKIIEVYFGTVASDVWDGAAQLFETNNYRLCGQLNNFIFANLGLVASTRCQKSDTVPYVCVLEKIKGKAPSTANVKAAIAVCRAYVDGIDAGRDFRLD